MSRKSSGCLVVFAAILCLILLVLITIALVFTFRSPASDNTTTPPQTTLPGTVPTTEPPTSPTTLPTTVPTEPPVVKESTFTLSATGDMLMHSPIFNAAATTNGYDFSSVFRWFASYVTAADYAVGNLETTLAGTNNGYPYSGYPNFNCPDQIIDGMKNAGFDMVLTANNHSYDTKSIGLTRTQSVIANAGLDWLGTQMDAEDPDYVLVERNGITLGLMCYTYETNTDPNIKAPNGHTMSSTDAPLINTFNYEELSTFYAEVEAYMAEMETQGAEAFVIFVHWGNEYQTTQNSTQSAMAQQLCDLGIDVIIGGHPHVVQPVELLTSNTDETHKTVCLYSMGNAVSNQRLGNLSYVNTAHTEDGVLFSVTFAKYSDGTVILERVDLLPTWVFLGTSPVTGKWEYNILPLDASAENWQEQMQLSNGTLAQAKESYNRTMAIVGAGMAEVNAYLSQHVLEVETQLGVTSP